MTETMLFFRILLPQIHQLAIYAAQGLAFAGETDAADHAAVEVIVEAHGERDGEGGGFIASQQGERGGDGAVR